MLNKLVQRTLNNSFNLAFEYGHEFATIEHLLLELLDLPDVQDIILALGANIEKIEKDLEDYLEAEPSFDLTEDHQMHPTMGFQRVIERAIYLVQSNAYEEVLGVHLLASFFAEQDSQAVYILEKNNLKRLDVLSFISHGDLPEDHEIYAEEMEFVEDDEPKNVLNDITQNLNKRALEGRIDEVIGRNWEIDRVLEILSRRRKNNPILVGEPGVGKTSIAEGLAYRIVHGEVPEILADATIFSLDMGALLAGTRYRGDFEKRFRNLLKEIEKQPNAILFIDEIHTIIGAGAVQGGALDVSNLMKPGLANGTLRCIGATTFEEYRGVFEKDKALARRFQKVEVREPTVHETYQILCGLKPHFEKHHEVKYTLPALKSAAELASRYINDRFLPDKAIDVIDEAGAKQRLLPASRRKKQISVADIQQVVANIARIPVANISRQEKDKLQDLETALKRVIFGQNPAISTVVNAIKLARSGLASDTKPTGSFLFAGPTGVGKTELAQQLAKHLGVELLRFDMSEYMERHTVSRLIGAPPGYVGYDQGGLLTEAVHKQPYSVVLLDEIEKAHPDVFNLLLQVMDNGTLTDNNGRKINFRNVILILTSNVGAEEMSRASIGFSEQDHAMDFETELKKLFKPEFRNRLDAVVQFKSLTPDSMESVVNKFIYALEQSLLAKKVSLKLSAAARSWLAEKGYDPKMGARPMERLVQEKIKQPLAEKLLFGELQAGGDVLLDVKQGQLQIKTKPIKELADA